MREAIYFDRQIEPWMHHPTLPWLQIQIVAEGIGWSWIVKLLIWASRVTLVLKDIKQSSSQCGPGPVHSSWLSGAARCTRDAAHFQGCWHVTRDSGVNTDPGRDHGGSITTLSRIPRSLLGQSGQGQRNQAVRTIWSDQSCSSLLLLCCCPDQPQLGRVLLCCCHGQACVVECQGWIRVR